MAECEICGRKTTDLYLVSIEGTKMQTCEQCSASGTIISRLQEAKPTLAPEERIIQEKPELEIVDNYAELIRNAREKHGMTTEEFARKINENETQIKKLEQGKMTPTEKTAKKLEKLLGIKLYTIIKQQSFETKKTKAITTLGDIVKIKQK